MNDINKDTYNIPELQSPFEQLREVDADGKEWWNSRKLARVMGYGKYWNFERVIAKAQAWTSQKGYHLGEHFVEITEMAELGSGAVREVTSIRLYVGLELWKRHDFQRNRAHYQGPSGSAHRQGCHHYRGHHRFGQDAELPL